MNHRSRLTKSIIAAIGTLAAPLAFASVEQPPVTQVPEPETLVLFAIGMTAVAIARRIRR